MDTDGYRCLRVVEAGGIVTATIDHPPINLLDASLMIELDRFSAEVAADPDVRVVVLASAVEGFFIAHADVGLILGLAPEPADPDAPLGFFHTMVERFRTMDKPTVAVVEGRCGGGGSELALSCDLIYAATETAVFCQMEVPLGILPGGSGTQRLPARIGRGRALEVIWTGEEVDAATAERWGWVERALPRPRLWAFVDVLVRRLASLPPHAVAAAKRAVDGPEVTTGLSREWAEFTGTLGHPETRRRLARFLEVGGQTHHGERHLAATLDQLTP